ncbi:MAG: sulfatase-like hydrolase/transferase, partial [Candidatus Omnitrophica bacterium]|nr:sulfatase-like hydrolase/transferase [Candidatus Omnitrophota bacterium]
MAKKHNLLFIFTDEQRFDTMACYGNSFIHTPNLNALSKESFIFENAYVSQPVCTPSRSTILTGLYPHTNGCISNNVPLLPEIKTIAEMVSEEYLCAYYGKWHLGDEIIPQHGFEKWVSIEDVYRPYYSREEYLAYFSSHHHFLIENGFTPDIESKGAKIFSRWMAANLPERFTKASFLGEEAARFIKENCNRPFILYVNFLEPHMPFTGPFNKMYPPEKLPTNPHFLQRPPKNASLVNRIISDFYNSKYSGYNLKNEKDWRKIRAQYLGLVTLVDKAVGVILRALYECGIADNTIVV